jgi:hypothetical protein
MDYPCKNTMMDNGKVLNKSKSKKVKLSILIQVNNSNSKSLKYLIIPMSNGNNYLIMPTGNSNLNSILNYYLLGIIILDKLSIKENLALN